MLANQTSEPETPIFVFPNAEPYKNYQTTFVELFSITTSWLLREIMKFVSLTSTPCQMTFPDINPEKTVVNVA